MGHDAIRSATLMCQVIADAVMSGKALRPSQVFEPDEPSGPEVEFEERVEVEAPKPEAPKPDAPKPETDGEPVAVPEEASS